MTPASPGLLRVKPSWREILPIVLLSLIACLLADIPHFVACFAQDDTARSAWVSVAPVDQLSYFAKMNQGRLGEWTFHLAYTAEPQKGGPVYLFYLFLGHVCSWTGLSIPLVYHLTRLLCGMLLLIVGYLFLCQITDDRQQRRFSFFLMAFGGGIGWFLMLFGEYDSADLALPDSTTFLGLMGPPQIIVGQALMLIVWMMLLAPEAESRLSITPLLVGGIACALVALIQPFLAAPLLGTAGVYTLWVWWQKRQIPRTLIVRTGLFTLVILPLVGFTAYILNNDPGLRGWIAQNKLPSPPVINYLAGYGLLVVGALFGLKESIRSRREIDMLLVSWLIVTVIGLYAPTDFQRRLSSGLHPLLSFLAGIGVYHIWLVGRAAAHPRLVTRAFLGTACMLTPALVLVFSAGSATHHWKLFYSRDEGDTFTWLREQAEPDTVVLSSTELGAFVPAFTNQRAVSGHGYETINHKQTESDVLTFYSHDVTIEKQRQLLANWHVAYVIWGPRERELDEVISPDERLLTLIAQFGDVALYRPTPQ